jgi:hypothetical protein
MSWQVEFRPEVRDDVSEAAHWYEARESGLGGQFVGEIIEVWDALSANPLIGSRRHPVLDIRWRYPKRFPYRVGHCCGRTFFPNHFKRSCLRSVGSFVG